jgi:hypothetical protein
VSQEDVIRGDGSNNIIKVHDETNRMEMDSKIKMQSKVKRIRERK